MYIFIYIFIVRKKFLLIVLIPLCFENQHHFHKKFLNLIVPLPLFCYIWAVDMKIPQSVQHQEMCPEIQTVAYTKPPQ